jgi:energy-coupling factor transporter transmembrane protein EcfT
MAPVAACICALFLVGLLISEGLDLAKILREASFLIWLAAFTVLVQGLDFRGGIRLNEDGLKAALAYCARLLAAYLAGRLFYAATTRSELRDAATRIVRILPGRARSDVGLVLSLVLGFLPLIVDEWRSSLEAAHARGMPKRPGLGRSATLLSAFLRRLMLAALSLPEALAARAWAGTRVVLRTEWRFRDYAAVCSTSLLLILAILHVV